MKKLSLRVFQLAVFVGLLLMLKNLLPPPATFDGIFSPTVILGVILMAMGTLGIAFLPPSADSAKDHRYRCDQ
ncbi:hypothetical protein [Paraburkholderia sp. SIMBA_054]|uniref:hypothetical protein n=1 Tax=Paraburkholderia sp. SIMBA_054 TaxID=3085795 RepID=UPI00397CA3FD